MLAAPGGDSRAVPRGLDPREEGTLKNRTEEPGQGGSATFRVLVTGSRTWWDYEAIFAGLAQLAREHAHVTVVHGAARDGADRFAALSAKALGLPQEPHPADWKRYNRSAGPVRNAEMVALGADLCLAFIKDSSRGATHCAGLAEKAGIPVRRFTS